MTDAALQTDRTCGRHLCGAEPCYIHRRDAEAVYVERPVDAQDGKPACQHCGKPVELRAQAGGGGMDALQRRKYVCPSCFGVTVVEIKRVQQRLGAFATDGGEANV